MAISLSYITLAGVCVAASAGTRRRRRFRRQGGDDEVYSDGKVANRDITVWHFVI